MVEKVRGVSRAALMMGTPASRELLAGAGLLVDIGDTFTDAALVDADTGQ